MAIIILGSINMDLVARTPRLPAPAETIIGHAFFTAPGGKGANQAVAAARLQIPTIMVGRVGRDGFGAELQAKLQQAGVNIAPVAVSADTSSGVAIIAVDDAAQNNIIIVPGANGQVGQAELDRLADYLPEAKLLLLQLEVPLATTLSAAKLAKSRGLTVVLDPAPAQVLPAELYTYVDIITPNEVEAAQLVGFPVVTPADAFRAAAVLLERGVQIAIIKMGAAGVAYATQSGEQNFIPAFKIEAVDTTAAGDAFNGGLAAGLAEGLPLPEAIRWGAAVGALSATKAGAQPSMPDRRAFEQFLQERV
jgi:ribokinase